MFERYHNENSHKVKEVEKLNVLLQKYGAYVIEKFSNGIKVRCSIDELKAIQQEESFRNWNITPIDNTQRRVFNILIMYKENY